MTMACSVQRIRELQKSLISEDETKVLKLLKELERAQMTFDILMETGIGKTVNSLRHEPEYGEVARQLVAKWKQLASNSISSASPSSHDDPPSVSNSYPGPSCSSVRPVVDKHLSAVNPKSSNSHGYNRESSSNNQQSSTAISSGNNRPNLKSDRNSNSEMRNGRIKGCDSEYKQEKPVRPPQKRLLDEAGFSNQCGTSFEDILGMSDGYSPKSISNPKRRPNVSSQSNNANASSSGNRGNEYVPTPIDSLKIKKKMGEDEVVNGFSSWSMGGRSANNSSALSATNSSKGPSIKIEPLEKMLSINYKQQVKSESSSKCDLLSSFAGLNTNYKPLRLPPKIDLSELDFGEVDGGDSTSGDDTIAAGYSSTNNTSHKQASADCDVNLTSKKKATIRKVFAGRKSGAARTVPSLRDECIKVLTEHIDSIKYFAYFMPTTGQYVELPFDIVKPVIEKLPASKLETVEENNPHFADETDYLWETHCRRDFKDAVNEDDEPWRDVYQSMVVEREQRLKMISKSLNGRKHQLEGLKSQAKTAFVDVIAKPPPSVRRAQMKYGTGRTDVQTAKDLVEYRRQIDQKPASVPVAKGRMKANGCPPSVKRVAQPVQEYTAVSLVKKQKTGLLMAKAKQMMKRRF